MTIKLSNNVELNDTRLFIVAGPCTLEKDEVNKQVIEQLIKSCRHLNLPFILKANLDAYNHTSLSSYSLAKLTRLKDEYKIPILTDIYEPWQAQSVASIADIIQIPAPLSYQADLLEAVVKTNAIINIVKDYSCNIQNIAAKIESFGAKDRLTLTETGCDMRTLSMLQKIGCHVIFNTVGNQGFASMLAQCAVVAGCNGISMDIGPDEIQLNDINELIISLNTLHLYRSWREKEKIKCQKLG